MRKLLLIPLVALGACVACVPAKQPAPPPPPPSGGVVVYGDSIIEEARPYLDADVRAFGGTALCDWSDAIVQMANDYHPRLIVLSFIGNNVTPCMEGTWTDEDVRARYFIYMTSLKQRIPNQPLLWVVNPIIHDSVRGLREPTPNPLYVAEPSHVDAGAAVEGPGGEYLPEYRLDDGLHLNDAGAQRFATAINEAAR